MTEKIKSQSMIQDLVAFLQECGALNNPHTQKLTNNGVVKKTLKIHQLFQKTYATFLAISWDICTLDISCGISLVVKMIFKVMAK